MREFMRALRVLHRAYRDFPLRDRMHVDVRFLTCPFLPVVNSVPAGARVLEIGAGHGVFAVLARSRASRVVAVDPDARKVRRLTGIDSVIGFDDSIRGTFDVIALVDVLYKIPMAEWDNLLARVTKRLAKGGILLIKELDPSARIKHRWNRLQERMASALGLTLGEAFSYETPEDFVRRLERHGLAATAKRIDRGYPHAHILYVARRK